MSILLVGASLLLSLAAAAIALTVGVGQRRPPWIALGVGCFALGLLCVDALLVGSSSDLRTELGMFAFSVLAFSVTLGFRLEQARFERQLEEERSRYEPMSNRLSQLERDTLGLKSASDRYRLAALGAKDGLWSLDLDTGLMHLTARYCELFGLAADETTTSLDTWFESVHLDDAEAVRAAFDAYLAGDWPAFECEHRFRSADGRELWVKTRGVARRTPDGRAHQVAGSMSDITRQKLAELEGAASAHRDQLTGLLTRVRLVATMADLFSMPDLGQGSFALLVVDVDRFKSINASLGSRAADRLLVTTARRLNACVRPNDMVARIGAHTFAILLGDVVELGRVTTIANRVLAEMAAPILLEAGEHVSVTGSVGIAFSSLNDSTADQTLADAEVAMRHARQLGAGRWHVFDTDLRERVRNEVDIEAELMRGAAEEQFFLEYQPIVALSTGRIRGFEALVRWRHPTLGLLSPNRFIPIAEQNGSIVGIGRIVLLAACRQARAWSKRFGSGEVFVNVNVSGRQLQNAGLVEDVRRVLVETGADPDSVKLEITESVLVSEHETTSRSLAGLRALGLELCIDDFGTGYSSLGYLGSLPVDKLKIDRCMVSGIQAKPETAEVVRSIRELARKLGKTVVAEGVETGAELAKLRELDCDYAQGYFFSGPVAADEATRLVEREIFAFDEPVGRVSNPHQRAPAA